MTYTVNGQIFDDSAMHGGTLLSFKLGAGQVVPGPVQLQRKTERPGQILLGEGVRKRPGVDDLAALEEQKMAEARRNLLDMVAHEHRGR